MALLIFAFFMTALLYASVGFGGGSTYNALLVLSGSDYRILPAIALICNIIVVAGGVWRFGAAGQIHLKRLAPFVIVSVPLAWLGGRLAISETLFVALLGLSLLGAGLRMLTPANATDAAGAARERVWLSAGIGGALGFLSGLVGIGGGIFLAPVLYMMRWGSARAIAGAASFFILVNSISGLAGQMTKLGGMQMVERFADYWPLFPAVLIGGQIGSRLGATGLSESLLRRGTAILVLYVAARLIIRWYGLIS